jgi:AraC-like DNA-binding protein
MALMSLLKSAFPSSELFPYVRAFAQRKLDSYDAPLVEAVPAQLEQVLNFELGLLPGVHHRCCTISSATWIGGAQTSFAGYMDLRPGVESFAIFFQPAGWSQLFGNPVSDITNRILDASAVMGPSVRSLWNRLGEAASFEDRVLLAEEFLLKRLDNVSTACRMASAATLIFRVQGNLRMTSLAKQQSMGLRHFERQFQHSIGAAAKTFARVARFQAALDAKLAAPSRTWLEIAHYFGYYDQMHMIHDFQALGRHTPNSLIDQMGDVRPHALASANPDPNSRISNKVDFLL